MIGSFRKLLGLGGASAQVPAAVRPRLSSDRWPAVLYAIGDVHGCLDELLALEAMIEADAEPVEGDKWIIVLGDLIDRGPKSAGVIDHLLSPPPAGFTRFCLAGNHEAMFLEFWNNPTLDNPWLSFGGWETLSSYGLDQQRAMAMSRSAFGTTVKSMIPPEHVDMITSLPTAFSMPGIVLVHAGIVPGVDIADQSENDLLWIREPFLNAQRSSGPLVVHGHTIVSEPELTPHRINIDTGAYATGRLTAVRLAESRTPVFCRPDAHRSSAINDI